MTPASFNCEAIHAHTLEILSETGVQINNASIHRRLRRRGVRCDAGSGSIYFDSAHIEHALQSLPRQVVLAARDEADDLVLRAETRLRFMPSGTGVAVLDENSGQRRSSTLADVERFVRLCQRLPQVDISRPVVTATDRPSQQSDLYEFSAAFRYTTKHIHHRVLRRQNVAPLMDMAEMLAGGKSALRRRPLFSVCYCPTSPLAIVPETAECMLAFAEQGIPVLVLSMAMGGATAPATVLGEVMLVNAEILAGIVLIQTLNPGSPVMYGSVSSVMDMKTAILALGAPERGLVNGGLAQMANYYGIPCVMGGLSSDAEDVDFQSGFEKAMTAIPLLDRTNILFGLGMLHGGNTYSVQQFVLDAEAADALKKMASATRAEDSRQVCDLIKAVGSGNHYLLEAHTLAHYERYWRPRFFNRKIDNTLGVSAGSLINRVQRFLDDPSLSSAPKVIDDAVDRRLDSILNEAVAQSDKNA